MIKAVLFDLDGTLLPMDQEVFIKEYFGYLCAKFAPKGYDPKTLMDGVQAGIVAMVRNDGACTNEEVFWDVFAGHVGADIIDKKEDFLDFYRNEFQLVEKSCGKNAMARTVVAFLHDRGVRTVLATNPLFPQIATFSRTRWAGLDPEKDFEWITTYENCGTCKPNEAYYQEVLARIGLDGAECMMVGNDVQEDMVAETLGMKVFLLTDCLIDRNETDLSRYPHGDFEDLLQFLGENI